MAEITAAMVKDLRERSGLPMMDCKQALTETGGDPEKALELLRKRGAAAAEKKAGRATSEGRVGSHLDKAKGIGALVEMLCESAPVSNNPLFKDMADKIAKVAAVTGETDAEKMKSAKLIDDPSQTVADLIHSVVNIIRENMQIGRIVRMSGHPAVYVHFNGKLGVILNVEAAVGDESLLNDVCMHIAAMSPQGVARENVPADLVAKERDIVAEQVKASGKPANMIEKIVSGKIDRWFSERVLLEQPFVKDDKRTVGEVLKGAGLKVTEFNRLQVGVA